MKCCKGRNRLIVKTYCFKLNTCVGSVLYLSLYMSLLITIMLSVCMRAASTAAAAAASHVYNACLYQFYAGICFIESNFRKSATFRK